MPSCNHYTGISLLRPFNNKFINYFLYDGMNNWRIIKYSDNFNNILVNNIIYMCIYRKILDYNLYESSDAS